MVIIAVYSITVFRRSHLSSFCLCELLKFEHFTIVAIKSLIFAAQKVITFHWMVNEITYVMSAINHDH